MVQTGITADWKARGIVLFFLILSLLASRGRRSLDISRQTAARCVIIGFLLFLASPVIFARIGDPVFTDAVYIGTTVAGYLLLMAGAGRLLRAISLPWSTDDPFGKKQSGFPQERGRITGANALHLPTRHRWKEQQHDQLDQPHQPLPGHPDPRDRRVPVSPGLSSNPLCSSCWLKDLRCSSTISSSIRLPALPGKDSNSTAINIRRKQNFTAFNSLTSPEPIDVT